MAGHQNLSKAARSRPAPRRQNEPQAISFKRNVVGRKFETVFLPVRRNFRRSPRQCLPTPGLVRAEVMPSIMTTQQCRTGAMLLAIEQGNTNSLFAVHDGEHWIARWRAATQPSAAFNLNSVNRTLPRRSHGLRIGGH